MNSGADPTARGHSTTTTTTTTQQRRPDNITIPPPPLFSTSVPTAFTHPSTSKTAVARSAKQKAKALSPQVIVTQHHVHDGHDESAVIDDDDDDDDDRDVEDDGSENDTVGTLLADIANAISDARQLLMFADKRHWTSDEFEQVRALELALDQAKADFQELGPLLKGTFYYENDRRPESLQELRILRMQFGLHGQAFKDWLRQGGPINPLWTRDTLDLSRDLHRAQRRAAARIFASQQADVGSGGTGHRCLGAFEVYRRQRRLDDRRKEYGLGRRSSRYESARGAVSHHQQQATTTKKKQRPRPPSWQQKTPTMAALEASDAMEMGTISLRDNHEDQERRQQQQQQQQEGEQQKDQQTSSSLEHLVPACNSVGRFERFGDRDIAFSCDFCDGFLVWEDLESMPAELDALQLPAHSGGVPASASAPANPQDSDEDDAQQSQQPPHWQARGKSIASGEAKTVVFAPLAIANHMSPDLGEWQARILCPYCDEYKYYEAGDEDETHYVQDDRGFGSVAEFQAHLEWYHVPVAVPGLSAAAKSCVVM